MTRDVDGIEPLERSDASVRPILHHPLDALDARGQLTHQLRSPLAATGGIGNRMNVLQGFTQSVWVQRDDSRAGRDLLGKLRDLGVGHRAYGTQGLCDDQVWLKRSECLAIELVNRIATQCALPHRHVDLRGTETDGQHIARDLVERCSGWRVVALVCDRHHLGTESEREQQLRGVRDEADDAHANETVRAPSSESARCRSI